MTQESGRIWVMGGRPLNGTAAVPAAKNSVLPLLAAALLCRGTVRLRAVPALSDVECCLALLRGAGCDARRQGADVVVSGTPVCSTLPGDAAARMRASILFCAPLLARLGRAETSLPGGCPIGQRPIDLHLEGLGRMGAKELDAGAGRLVLAAPGGLHGADFTLRFPSVGATETLLLAAVCARGTTVLRGAAREPEISDLADFLRRCGGQIEGAGTSTIRIEGRRVLDLFAGTGQLGIECLSRGADRCTFVDLRKEAAALIRENLTWCALQERAQVIQGDYLAYLTRCGEKFDLILLDPPYGSGLLEKALESIAAIDILSENGIMVCESAVEQVLPELKSPYTRGKDYRYGKIKLTVYRRDAD